MKRIALVVASPIVLVACTAPPTLAPTASSSVPSQPPGTVSCQPYSYTPAPIPFSFDPGPVTAAVAETTAVNLFRSCQQPTTITDLTSTTTDTVGLKDGPNAGQAVWLVQVDATVAEPSPGAIYRSHFLIEVNQATGIPMVRAYG